ncbi:L-tyrosine/L-tryptophan isonitrile synthase family protein [Nocardia sp. NPDC049149]|uniref:L-tyrosine/L-tryptophan isonitrile synthase family protein n=1 Tax=Nocardia sp. NPDC049149 TaxID=3364315 RepID=UPI0037204D2F
MSESITPPLPLAAEAVATDVLRLVFARRRSAEPDAACDVGPCGECFAPHLKKVIGFVEAGKPVHFVIPAFPAKSRNRRKTLGRLPDMAETLAIESLQGFCDQVSAVYAPGAIVTICSDGHVFSDSLGIPDPNVDEYAAELRRVIRSTGGGSIGLYGLRDAMPGLSWDARRARLLEEFATSIEAIRESVKTDPAMRRMFNGIHRFMVEDNTALMPELSATQRRNRSKETAYEVVQRSQAWSGLVAGVFPDAVRLSIHPQTHHSGKIGFHLLRTPDNWLTPWHGVVLDDGTKYTLIKRAEAEDLGARLIWRNSRPSHFVLATRGTL